jgi:hypothetical protein
MIEVVLGKPDENDFLTSNISRKAIILDMMLKVSSQTVNLQVFLPI